MLGEGFSLEYQLTIALSYFWTTLGIVLILTFNVYFLGEVYNIKWKIAIKLKSGQYSVLSRD